MFEGSPIENKGYYDVPICNEYSNKEIRDPPIITNEYALNSDIRLRINDNQGNYTVYQDPTIPSPSLYTESDQSMAGYYHKNPLSLSYENPIVSKKNSKIYDYMNSDLYPPFGIEKFSNSNNKQKILLILLIIILLISIFYFTR